MDDKEKATYFAPKTKGWGNVKPGASAVTF